MLGAGYARGRICSFDGGAGYSYFSVDDRVIGSADEVVLVLWGLADVRYFG
jgi:hypothetical protein